MVAIIEWSEAKLNYILEGKGINIETPKPNLTNLKTRATEFNLNIQNRYRFLSDEDNSDQINKQFSDMIKEATLEVAFKCMKREKSPDGISIDLIMDAGEIAMLKLAKLSINALSIAKLRTPRKRQQYIDA